MAADRIRIAREGVPVAFLYVGERDRALAFYREVLGAEHRSRDMFGDFLAINGALVRMTVLPDHKPSAHPVLGWNVDDIAAVAEALAERGVGLIRYEGMDQDDLGIWTAPDGTKVAFFADPEGNVLSLAQMAERPAAR
jgi:predicted enzyme related to lactoylglutathione lyase